MRLTGTFVLPEDAVLQPVLELGEEFRQQSGSDDGDFALTRRNSRSMSKVVDADAAALLRNFEKPSTIAMAVARFSRSQGGDPERTLEDALPMLQALISEGLLVGENAEYRPNVAASMPVGTEVEGWTVTRCLQSLEDTEVYRVRGRDGEWGAMKICRHNDPRARASLKYEARILGGLSLGCLPRVLASGETAQGEYLVTEWFGGVDVERAAMEYRAEEGIAGRAELLRLSGAILDAYAELHEAGLLHGDVHPRNVLVDGRLGVKMVDFGLARVVSEILPGYQEIKAGVSFFFEPEYARSVLEDRPSPPPSFAGEQYALAALLYLLMTGSHTQDFSLERAEMLRQIARGEVVSFQLRGIAPWPEVEGILARALSKEAGARFASVRQMAESWRAVADPDTTGAPEAEPGRVSRLGEVRREVLRKSAIVGSGGVSEPDLWMRGGFPHPPVASINYGSAGLAFALYRLACAADDGELLAAADAWSARAIRAIGSPEGFVNDDFGITPKNGRASFYHGPAGLHAVQAMVAGARGDRDVQSRATAEFIARSRAALQETDADIDLTLGWAGNLLGSAFLLDAWGDGPAAVAGEKAALRTFGQEIDSRMWSVLDGYSPVGEEPGLAALGIAHGWAGLLYASLCWCAAAGCEISPVLQERLQQLADRAEPAHRGLHWLWGNRVPLPGWCNGSGGFVFLWTEAYRALKDERYSALAERAAWSTWELAVPHGSLCCGLGGQAYALLNFYRHSGDAVWLARARKLADLAAEAQIEAGERRAPGDLDTRAESLYKGKVGIAVLEADLESPLEARMPLFERE